jgi:hypothetical protein
VEADDDGTAGRASSVCAEVDAMGCGFSMPGGDGGLRVGDGCGAGDFAVSAMVEWCRCPLSAVRAVADGLLGRVTGYD